MTARVCHLEWLSGSILSNKPYMFEAFMWVMKSFFLTYRKITNKRKDWVFISHLSILICNSLDTVNVFISNVNTILITHGNILRYRDCPISTSISFVKQFAQSWKDYLYYIRPNIICYFWFCFDNLYLVYDCGLSLLWQTPFHNESFTDKWSTGHLYQHWFCWPWNLQLKKVKWSNHLKSFEFVFYTLLIMQSFIVHPKSYAKVQYIFLKSKRFSGLNFILCMQNKLKAMLYKKNYLQ